MKLGARPPGTPKKVKARAATISRATIAYVRRETAPSQGHLAIGIMIGNLRRWPAGSQLDYWLAQPKGSRKEKLLRSALADGALRAWAAVHGTADRVDDYILAGQP